MEMKWKLALDDSCGFSRHRFKDSMGRQCHAGLAGNFWKSSLAEIDSMRIKAISSRYWSIGSIPSHSRFSRKKASIALRAQEPFCFVREPIGSQGCHKTGSLIGRKMCVESCMPWMACGL